MGRRKKSEGAPLSLFSFQDIMACLTGILILIALLLAIDGLSDDMQAAPGKSASPEAVEAAKARQEAAAELRRRAEEIRKAIESARTGRPVTEQEVAILEARAAQLEVDRETQARILADAERERARVASEASAAELRARELRESAERAERDAKAEELRRRVRFRPGEVFAKAPIFVEPMRNGIVIGELDGSRTPALVARLDDPGADSRAARVLQAFDPGASYVVFVVHEDAIARFAAMRRRLSRFEMGWQLWDAESSMLEGAPDGPHAAREAPDAGGGAP